MVSLRQFAQWGMIAHLRASVMFGDTIFYNAQKQVALNLKQQSGLNSNTSYYASSAYLQAIKMAEKTLGNYIFSPSRAANSIVSG